MQTFKKDEFRTARGGYSRVLEVLCEKCNSLICYYQKDGPGPLKRMYVDRVIDKKYPQTESLKCSSCGFVVGEPIIYEKENRAAFRMYESSVMKRVVKKRKVGN